jgi:hypothetical protein
MTTMISVLVLMVFTFVQVGSRLAPRGANRMLQECASTQSY